MQALLTNYVQIRQLPTGRASFAAKCMREIAQREGASAEVFGALDAAGVQAKESLRLNLAWAKARRAKTNQARGEAVLLDSRLDRTVGGLKKILEGMVVGDPNHPEVKAARKLMVELYPDGVAVITQGAFEEELGMVDAMLELLEGDLAGEVRLLHLGRQVTTMRAQAEALRVELARPAPAQVTYTQVKAQNNRLHEALCEVAVVILFETRAKTPDDIALRQKLLGPLNDQQARVLDAARRHRSVLDVDPQTGIEIAPEDEALDDTLILDQAALDQAALDQAALDQAALDQA